MKKSLKVFCMIILFMSIMVLNTSKVFAAGPSKTTSKSAVTYLKEADNWKENGESGIVGSTQNIVGTAINVIRIVGTGIAIIMLTYVAIKYMSAAPSEKAEFKKSATAMIVGAIVLFAASNILQVIANFANKNIVTG